MAPLNLWTIQEKNGTDALLYTAVWKLSCINLLLRTWKYVLTDRLLMEVSFPVHCEIGFTIDWAHKPCNAKCYHIKGCRKSKLNDCVLVATSASEWYCLCCLSLKKMLYHLSFFHHHCTYKIISNCDSFVVYLKTSSSGCMTHLLLPDTKFYSFFLSTCMKKYQRNTIKTIT